MKLFVALPLLTACTAGEQPPAVRQLIGSEVFSVGRELNTRRVFLHGSHVDAPQLALPDALILPAPASLRMVIDGQLDGALVHEVLCSDGRWMPAAPGCTEVACLATCDGAEVALVDGLPRLRLRSDAVILLCDELRPDLDLEASYWQPSGSQAWTGDPDALGPALVLWPRDGLPSGTVCQLGLGACGEQACDPAPVRLGVAPLAIDQTVPLDGSEQVFVGQTPRVSFNARLHPASVAHITMTEAGASIDPMATLVDQPGPSVVTFGARLRAGTRYEISIPTAVLDVFGQPLAAPGRLSFVTRGGPAETVPPRRPPSAAPRC